MKNHIRCFILFCFSTTFSFAQNSVDEKLMNLYGRKSFFELQHEYKLNKSKISRPELNVFLEAEFDHWCNRRLNFEKSIWSVLNNHQDELDPRIIFTRTAFAFMNMIELGKYQVTYESSQDYLNQLKSSIYSENMDIITPFEEVKDLAKALSPYSPKQVIFPERCSVEVPLFFRKIGREDLMFIHASMNGGPAIPFVFDTGAECNCIIYEEYVEQYNIRLLDDDMGMIVRNAHSSTQQTKMGMIDSLSLGDVVVYNIPVLILSGEIDLPDNATYTPKTVIGWKLMETIGKIQIYPQEEKLILIKSDSVENKANNMMLYGGKNPIVEIRLDNNERLNMILDTGSSSTCLSSQYYKDNEQWILETLKEDESTLGAGFGYRKKMKTFIIPHLSFQFGEIALKLNDLEVIPDMKQPIGGGLLGLDFIRQFKKITLSFKDTYIDVEK